MDYQSHLEGLVLDSSLSASFPSSVVHLSLLRKSPSCSIPHSSAVMAPFQATQPGLSQLGTFFVLSLKGELRRGRHIRQASEFLFRILFLISS